MTPPAAARDVSGWQRCQQPGPPVGQQGAGPRPTTVDLLVVEEYTFCCYTSEILRGFLHAPRLWRLTEPYWVAP